MRRLATLAFAVASLSSLAAPRAHAGACAMPPPAVNVLTAPEGIVAAAGGIIAEIETTALPRWTFGAGKRAAASFTRIAPGLYRIAVPATGTLEDDAHVQLASVTVADHDPQALAAPAVRAVEHLQYNTRRGTVTSVTARFKVAPPDGAVALVAFAADDGHPRGWGRVAPGLEVPLFAAGSCVAVRPGVEELRAGERVTLAWVDGAGRLSPRSATLTVATATAP